MSNSNNRNRKPQASKRGRDGWRRGMPDPYGNDQLDTILLNERRTRIIDQDHREQMALVDY